MVCEVEPVDRAIGWVAASQYGVVTTAQLVAVGLSRAAISKRARAGRLHRLHQGVYAVGHRDRRAESCWMAAVLACGPGAVLSHEAAACLWRLLRWEGGPVDVSVPSKNGRSRRRGIRIHYAGSLASRGGSTLSTHGLQNRAARLVAVRHRIPVTSPARTLRDIERTLPPFLVRKATRQAEYLGLPLAGIATDGTRSDLEGAFLELCRHHRLPAPEVNVKIGRWTVDFLWREQRLAVETDSYAAHRGRIAFQEDRARELELRRAGFAVHRFSELQLEAEPALVAADLAAALRRART